MNLEVCTLDATVVAGVLMETVWVSPRFRSSIPAGVTLAAIKILVVLFFLFTCKYLLSATIYNIDYKTRKDFKSIFLSIFVEHIDTLTFVGEQIL